MLATGRTQTTRGRAPAGGPGVTVATRRLSSGASNRIPATYLLQRFPGDAKESFSVAVAVRARSRKDNARQQLTAFLTARSDPGEYGRLVVYRMPTGQQINGPPLVDVEHQADAAVAQQVSLLDQQGSQVRFGNVLLVPINDSILYIRPLYIQATENGVPQLVRVIVVYGNRSEMREHAEGGAHRAVRRRPGHTRGRARRIAAHQTAHGHGAVGHGARGR